MIIIEHPERIIPETELYDSERNEFIIVPSVTVPSIYLQLEHSLISIANWESRWHVSFTDHSQEMTSEQLISYIECMTINRPKNKEIYRYLTEEDMTVIVDYISDTHTAYIPKKKKQSKTSKNSNTTAETIYFLMIEYGIPFECQKWHFNRLMALIEICGDKGSSGGPEKKRSEKEMMAHYMALNKERRAKLNSKG